MPNLTPAERQRRSRAHKANDHRLCDPMRCPNAAVAPATTPDEGTQAVLPRNASRGERLSAELLAACTTPGQKVLAEEAGRIADRLDRIDAFLQGKKDWLRIRTIISEQEDDVRIKISIDGALAEARQQQVALKALISELRLSTSAAPAKPGARPPTVNGKAGAGASITDLASKIAARRGTTPS
jgi:hypothetical protein